MKKIKGFIIISVCLFIATISYLSLQGGKQKFVQTTQPKVIETAEVVSEEIENKEFISLEEEVYNAEYQRGRRNFYNQMGIAMPDKNEKKFEYAVLKEIPEEEKSKYEEIMAKGYVDGYHKAGEALSCPKGCPY
jgi:flagellar biosynthesis/type III secretory pathway protein FliH